MNARELMIGDWVYVSKNFTQKYHKVRYIDDDGGIGCRYVNEHGIECKSALVMDYVQPIPLTSVILEKNGFHHPKFNDCTDVAYDKDGLIVLHTSGLYFYISTPDAYIHIIFVHELQHALRLCGLNSLADNFKI